jgi:hypothetical protein
MSPKIFQKLLIFEIVKIIRLKGIASSFSSINFCKKLIVSWKNRSFPNIKELFNDLSIDIIISLLICSMI